jgi:hypothetical protein
MLLKPCLRNFIFQVDTPHMQYFKILLGRLLMWTQQPHNVMHPTSTAHLHPTREQHPWPFVTATLNIRIVDLIAMVLSTSWRINQGRRSLTLSAGRMSSVFGVVKGPYLAGPATVVTGLRAFSGSGLRRRIIDCITFATCSQPTYIQQQYRVSYLTWPCVYACVYLHRPK